MGLDVVDEYIFADQLRIRMNQIATGCTTYSTRTQRCRVPDTTRHHTPDCITVLIVYQTRPNAPPW